MSCQTREIIQEKIRLCAVAHPEKIALTFTTIGNLLQLNFVRMSLKQRNPKNSTSTQRSLLAVCPVFTKHLYSTRRRHPLNFLGSDYAVRENLQHVIKALRCKNRKTLHESSSVRELGAYSGLWTSKWRH